MLTYSHKISDEENIHTYSDEEQNHHNYNTTICQTPIVAKTKNWFTTHWDYIYNKYRIGNQPRPGPETSEDKLTNTIINIGETPTYIYVYIYNTMRQDVPGGPSKTIIPTFTKGYWHGADKHKNVTLSNIVRVQEYTTYDVLIPLKPKNQQ